MKIEVGSTWVNKNDLENTVTVDTVGAFAVTVHSDKDGLYIANIEDFLHYFEPLPDSRYESLSELSEQEFENIIDEAFEEGYAQAYSELQTKTERERALQEKAWDEGYDQAVYDLIDEGIFDGLDEEGCYSEYEFGDVEDDEEEYCFSKELDRILNGEKSQCEVDPTDSPAFGGRYDEDGKLCGFFINTGGASKGGYRLVGISGLARSGKDVAGEIILENLGEGWARGAFADIPKEMLFVMGVDTKYTNKDGEDEYYQYNIRHLMQTLGTDWGRNIDNDIWIKAFKKKNPTGNFVITDVRMENEADFVRDNGGVIIHVKGRGGIKGNHQSEAGIEIKRGDLLVFNDSDLENFEKEISNICKTLVKKV